MLSRPGQSETTTGVEPGSGRNPQIRGRRKQSTVTFLQKRTTGATSLSAPQPRAVYAHARKPLRIEEDGKVDVAGIVEFTAPSCPSRSASHRSTGRHSASCGCAMSPRRAPPAPREQSGARALRRSAELSSSAGDSHQRHAREKIRNRRPPGWRGVFGGAGRASRTSSERRVARNRVHNCPARPQQQTLGPICIHRFDEDRARRSDARRFQARRTADGCRRGLPAGGVFSNTPGAASLRPTRRKRRIIARRMPERTALPAAWHRAKSTPPHLAQCHRAGAAPIVQGALAATRPKSWSGLGDERSAFKARTEPLQHPIAIAGAILWPSSSTPQSRCVHRAFQRA